jgi:hypothetical protein
LALDAKKIMIMKSIYWLLAGGGAYWITDLLIQVIHREKALWLLLLTLLPTTIVFIVYLKEAKRFSRPTVLLPLSMLLGIWMVGPVFIAIGAQPHGGTFLSPANIHDFHELWAHFGVSTFVMSTYSGSLGGVTLISLILLITAIIQLKRKIASNKAL